MDLLLWNIVVGIACTVPCALLGCYLVLRRMSLLGDAISHGVLPGIVVAAMLTGSITGWAIVLGAMACGLLTALLTQWIHEVGDIPEDASMGVAFTGLFALGVVLISQMTFRADLDTGCVLYGLFEAIPLDTIPLLGFEVPRALPTMVGVLVLTVAFITVFWKELKLAAFDPDLATSMGFSATLVHYLLMAMVAGVTVTAFEAVGSVLVIAMLIVPGACAHLLSDRLPGMLLWSAAVATLATILGVLLSGPGLLNTNAPGMMAVSAGGLFGLTVLFAPKHGVAVRAVRNLRLGVRIVAEDIVSDMYKTEEAGQRGDAEAVARLTQQTATVSRSLLGRLATLVLRWRGRLEKAPSGELVLTASGRERGKTLVRSHRLWERYLKENFPLPLDHLHDPAERIEHFIDPELQRQLASELHEPDVDPHGRAIPGSEGKPAE